MPSLDSSLSSRGSGSSGAPISDSRPAGDGVIPILTTETTLMGTGVGARTVNLGFCNRSGGAVSVTMYLKAVVAGVADAAAAKNTILFQYALPTTGEPVSFQALQGLVVDENHILTALLSTGASNAANAFVSGTVQR